MKWVLKKFVDLTTDELYKLLQLRAEVFIVEQQCVFQDLDNKDQASFHLMGLDNNKLVAYTRIVPPGVAYSQASIGRVVTSPAARGIGTGRKLMEQSIQQVQLLFGNSPIKIGAQFHLKKFYSSLGFEQTSGVYLEDGIEHIEMTRS